MLRSVTPYLACPAPSLGYWAPQMELHHTRGVPQVPWPGLGSHLCWQVPWSCMHGLPLVLAFACAGKCCSLTQPSLLAVFTPVSVKWVPWSSVSWPVSSPSLPHKPVNATLTQRQAHRSPTADPWIQFSCVLWLGAVVHPLLPHSQMGTSAWARHAPSPSFFMCQRAVGDAVWPSPALPCGCVPWPDMLTSASKPLHLSCLTYLRVQWSSSWKHSKVIPAWSNLP